LPDELIIFDYSGTLSIEATEFSRPANLIRHLQESGLSALGVDRADLFWEIVNATWSKGSTSSLGYKGVMQERIAELFPDKAVMMRSEISRAAGNFVDAYFDHSGIDENWRLILQKLWSDKSVDVVIATDHYAEATTAIIKHLGLWDISAAPLTAAVKSNFVVANSADIGFHKAERNYWEILKTNCGIAANRILLIDDFGMNEQSADAYSQEKETFQRRQKTISLLESVFSAHVQCFVFAAANMPIDDLVLQASEKITNYLADKSSL